jgi:hypothetical protein
MAALGLVLAAGTLLMSTMRAIGQCERVNILRMQDNVSEAVIWRTLRAAAVSAEQRGATPVAVEYRRLASYVTYTPQTDCQAANILPLTYDPPRPVRFDRLPDRVVDGLLPPPPSDRLP